MADEARGMAVTLLDAVLGEGKLLSQALADLPGAAAPAERARAQRLASSVLRHLGPADRLLAPHLRKAPPLTVRNILRLATVEMAADGAAPHGVVSSAVDLTRRGRRTQHLAGLVNAVLRRIAPASFAGLPAQHLPMWLRQPLVRRWGRAVVAAIEAVQAAPPPLDLTARPGLSAPGEPLPTGSFRLRAPGQVSALPGYEAGEWWVQDAAAALAVKLLDPQPGESVADLCAAPGGKTLQLAAAGARVTALDISEARLGRLRENLARTGLQAEVVAADLLTWQGGPFEAILLDAPCSATGTIRRHPDLPFVKDGSELPGLVALQAAMLDHALHLLAPGGRLVFCTCSLLEEEGEAQLAALLERHPELTVERPALPGVEPGWIGAEGGLRLRPDLWAEAGGMDGFFMARVRRP
ncbi:16S rRNA (cytosine967-C5)-methyltransferase [[Luteovulum] sphaeroides subsp. megalophilum]|uniref:RsmB/NOP family class I SAM-dependent RNA methyltransferase n=1 Tax=Cereibacter sphaeroides TaxID=1063 RepID=UPI000B74099B|nr:transcription antitermination factor NusB [Cereibacter sphaeroides]SNS63938.1 16S rRNA (cytosine967-C5)-methyltransferase [[Luteovulum] sphaeroides subsp. megalophilum]